MLLQTTSDTELGLRNGSWQAQKEPINNTNTNLSESMRPEITNVIGNLGWGLFFFPHRCMWRAGLKQLLREQGAEAE